MFVVRSSVVRAVVALCVGGGGIGMDDNGKNGKPILLYGGCTQGVLHRAL